MGNCIKSCLNCKRINKCSYENKRSTYFCNEWKPFKNSESDITLADIFSSSGVSVFEKHEADDYEGFQKPKSEMDYKTHEINLVKMMDQIFSENTPFTRDMKIDDRDLPEFNNFYDFCFDKQYGLINANMKPFSRQMWLGIKLFGEYCPKCSDKKFMSNIENCPVKMKSADFPERVQLLNKGVCPKCKRNKLDMIKDGRMNFYRELAACVGQRGGKSMTFSFFQAYITSKYLKMQKPSEVLTGLPNVTLTATFTATDLKTAMETLWQPYTDIIAESPWFIDYHKLLDHYSNKYGEEIYRQMETFVHYKHRKLFLSAASPNKRTLRGRTRFASAIDELGWFDSSQESVDKVRISADEIYGALDRSLKTVRIAAKELLKQGYYGVMPAYAFNISSPSSQQDKIMSLVRIHKESRFILTVHLPTWEYNPKLKKSDFQAEYEDNPIKAERDFGAHPPMTDSPFMENEEAIRNCFKDKTNRVDYEYKMEKKEGHDLLRHYAICTPRPNMDIPPAVMAIDAGLTNNSFAVVLGHRKNKSVIFDTVLEIAPIKGQTKLSYNKIFENVVQQLIVKMNVNYLFADRWNSAFLLDKCADDFKIGAKQVSVKYPDFTLFKSYVEGGRIELPKLEMTPEEILNIRGDAYPHEFKYKPAAHLYLQMNTVSDTKKTVTKGTNRTDDLFRAMVLASKFLLDEEWCAENLKKKKRNSEVGLGALSNSGSMYGSLITHNSGKGIAALGNVIR